ncbi:MAG: sigma-70 family RNA polymerase sigma factor [Oligoflexia bacterium]|nr:sigma-70 family RNA polymerase sigma factor [Oligoflexia bacterium]
MVEKVFLKLYPSLYKKYQKPIAQYVQSKVDNPETAAEITQEVFLKFFRFRSSYQEKYAFSTWLWTIAKNTVSDHLRSQSRSARSSELMNPEELASKEKSPETLTLRRDQIRKFLGAIRHLTRLQRRVLWMRVIRQLSYEEIAKKLGMSLSAAKNLAYRARLNLDMNGLTIAAW